MHSLIKITSLISLIALAEAHLRPMRSYEGGHWRRSETSSTGATEDNSNLQDSLTLATSLVQSNSNILGTESTVNGSTTAGIVASATSPNNFINFCANSSLPLMNGVQIRTGACNPIGMGEIGDFDTAPQTKIAFPTNGGTVSANTEFTVLINMKNFAVGSFTNADSTYYTAPCQLDSTTGYPIGHSHITIQAVNSLDDTTTLAPKTFAFFLGLKGGIDDNGQINGTVTGGLAAGTYRLATINTCSNHQTLNGAIAQRGSFDDMVYFTVVDDGSTGTASTTTTLAAIATSTSAPAATQTVTVTVDDCDDDDGSSTTSAAATTSTSVSTTTTTSSATSSSSSSSSSTSSDSTGSNDSTRSSDTTSSSATTTTDIAIATSVNVGGASVVTVTVTDTVTVTEQVTSPTSTVTTTAAESSSTTTLPQATATTTTTTSAQTTTTSGTAVDVAASTTASASASARTVTVTVDDCGDEDTTSTATSTTLTTTTIAATTTTVSASATSTSKSVKTVTLTVTSSESDCTDTSSS